MLVKKAAPLKLPEVKIEELTPSYGKFVAQPVEPGFGITLGNALRRVLLRSILGAAVTWIRIEGVLHEFSTIPYMKEDVLEFQLRVKRLAIRPLSGLPGKLYLRVKNREGEIKAGDIEPSSDFEIANPELVLATLDSLQASLSVEFNVEVGRGYLPSEKQDKKVLPADALLMDAIFSPIIRVNYYIETLPLPDKEYEKLFLEVWTNKAIPPDEAVIQAVNILTEQFSPFANIKQVVVSKPSQFSPDSPIDELPNLSSRTKNALKRGGIATLKDLLEWRKAEIKSLPQMGEKSFEELAAVLKELGFSLKSEAS